ncbi:DUF6113 family protein [Streptomyces sp. NPDC051218]|uniref:DUF6113 family protein n=1 Tax=Streptomyces sp. NPDC051218 TaxID=3365645 RepID=UPI0037B2164F
MSTRSRAASSSSSSSASGASSAAPPPGGSALAQPPNLGRFAAYGGLFLLGLVIGTAGALVQGAWFPGWFPGGLLLALLGAAGLFYGGARAVGTRAGAVAPAAGWFVSVMLLMASRPEGDFLFGAGFGSYAFLFGGTAVAVMCATLGRWSQPGGPAARLGK